MSDRKIITADQARALLDNAKLDSKLRAFRDKWDDEIKIADNADEWEVGTAHAERWANLFVASDDLAHTVIAQAEQIEKLERGGAELGRIIKDQLDMVLDATGLHHLIRDDGDGDWEAVWMTLIERAKAHPDYRNPEATP